ncbi:hypothetical protein [Bradyrhizobium sp.]|uniref:hypothetical protein n=1 Tax=Bradyrhizobium sp. TaxID=376 RepID=UPI004037F0FA
MQLRWLFNSPVKVTVKTVTKGRLPGEPELTSAESETEKTQGVFLTGRSLLTFPGATAAVLLVWQALGIMFPAILSSHWAPFILSMLVGLFIYVVGITDPKTILSRRDKLIALPIAFVNALQVFTAVIGISLLGK